MKTDMSCVVVRYKSKCSECKHIQQGSIDNLFVEVVLVDLLVGDVGIPICQECGENLTVLKEVRIRA